MSSSQSTVSYVVAADQAMDARPLVELLGRELGIEQLLVEGGRNVNSSMMAAGVVDEISILLRRASGSRRVRLSSRASCTFVTPSTLR